MPRTSKRPMSSGFRCCRAAICRWCADVVARMKEAGHDDAAGGRRHHSAGGRRRLEKSGVAAVYTPKDFELNRIMSDVVRIVERANGASNV